jgi:hypothetical protein
MKHHTFIGDEVLKEVVVEEPQEVEITGKPPETAQGRPPMHPYTLQMH